MSPPALTEVEARVLWTALVNAWAPRNGYDEFNSAMRKLCIIGRGYSCRDCTNLGTKASRFGGFVCDAHKAAEDEMLARGSDLTQEKKR